MIWKPMKNTLKTFWKKITQLTIAEMLLLLLAAGVGFYLIFRFSRQSETVLVDLTFERQGAGSNFFPPEYWQVMSIKAGDEIYNSLGNQIAVVKEAQQSPWRGGARLYTYLTVEMDALYQSARKIYTQDNTPLVVGETLSFVIGDTAYSGVIRRVYQPTEQQAKLTGQAAEINLFCREYDAWHAEAIAKLVVKNNHNEVKAEVTEAVIRPATMAVETADGRLVSALHPFKKDLDLTIALRDVECLNDDYCFYNQTQTFMVGDEFWLDSGTTWVGGNCSVKSFEILN
jgi:hypothetical protein